MRRTRHRGVTAALALCAALVLGAMGWLTRSVLAAEHDRSLAEARADLEERTRLALWRMDGEGASILLARNGMPGSDHPQASREDPLAHLHFEADADGKLISLKISDPTPPAEIANSFNHLQSLLAQHTLQPEADAVLQSAAKTGEANWQALPKSAEHQKKLNSFSRNQLGWSQSRNDTAYQSNSNGVERAQRAKVIDQTLEAQIFAPNPTPTALPTMNPMRATWIAGELFLLRQLAEPAGHIQGIWLNSTRLSERLRAEISDLLPYASLDPIDANASEDPLALVSFPFRLQRNELPKIGHTKPGGALIAGWIAVLCAIAAVALLLRGILQLSERRASFVSAVTHELRTPLTTFQLYTELLRKDAVKPEKRGHYFETLHREAVRLSHLVENVLAFSRIEKGSARATLSTLRADDLIRPLIPRLEERLREVGMRLHCDLQDSAWSSLVRVDAAAVDHILTNLCDNAAKYAAHSSPEEITLSAKTTRRTLTLFIADQGPGIPSAEHRRVFLPFHKSAA